VECVGAAIARQRHGKHSNGYARKNGGSIFYAVRAKAEGSQTRQLLKYGHESRGTLNQESLLLAYFKYK
jgi:hypothetical protein